MTRLRKPATAAFPRKTRMMLILLSAAVSLPLSAKAPRYPVLTPLAPQTGLIYPGDEDRNHRTFVLDVPDTVLGIRVHLSSAGEDLDLFMRHGSEMDDYSEADFLSETDEWLEDMVLYRMYETWFPSGRYYLDVVYNWEEMPRVNGRIVTSIPFTLEYETFDSTTLRRHLRPGEAADAVLRAENGHLAHFMLAISPGTEYFRVDILDTPGDVDLFLSSGAPAPVRDGYLATAETYLGRESLLIGPEIVSKTSGPFFLTVVEATMSEYPVPVRLILSEGNAPPATAPVPPLLPADSEGFDRARLASVQLVSRAGIGSGCMVGKNGFILTNDHVIRDNGNQVVSEITVAMALDPYEAPVELFLAEVVKVSPDDDLALLRITGDRWGRPLPRSYRFPVWELGDTESLSIGDSLLLTGYPWMGSGLSRTYLTLTRGILAGGERTPSGMILKTDAVISGGSSGGAVSDGRWRLLGLPTFVVSQDAAQLTYFVPVNRIPPSWHLLFR